MAFYNCILFPKIKEFQLCHDDVYQIKVAFHIPPSGTRVKVYGGKLLWKKYITPSANFKSSLHKRLPTYHVSVVVIKLCIRMHAWKYFIFYNINKFECVM